MNEMMTDTRPILGAFFRDTVGEAENRPQIALASNEDRAIDLSCRACGALALGAGLGFPVGVSAPLRFPPPTSDLPSVSTAASASSTRLSSRQFACRFNGRREGCLCDNLDGRHDGLE